MPHLAAPQLQSMYDPGARWHAEWETAPARDDRVTRVQRTVRGLGFHKAAVYMSPENQRTTKSSISMRRGERRAERGTMSMKEIIEHFAEDLLTTSAGIALARAPVPVPADEAPADVQVAPEHIQAAAKKLGVSTAKQKGMANVNVDKKRRRGGLKMHPFLLDTD